MTEGVDPFPLELVEEWLVQTLASLREQRSHFGMTLPNWVDDDYFHTRVGPLGDFPPSLLE